MAAVIKGMTSRGIVINNYWYYTSVVYKNKDQLVLKGIDSLALLKVYHCVAQYILYDTDIIE